MFLGQAIYVLGPLHLGYSCHFPIYLAYLAFVEGAFTQENRSDPTKVPKVLQARDSGIIGCPLDADPLDSLLIRLFDRLQ
jgi:hypothetical protein